MYIVIWEYQVREERQAEFETIYAPNGAWAELFKKGSGYLGTELIRSEQTTDTYITIDRWDSKESYKLFLQQWKAEYAQLDRRCEKLTSRENRLGSFYRASS